MANLIEKSKVLLILIKPCELGYTLLLGFLSCLVFNPGSFDTVLFVLGTLSWLFVSAASSIIRSYYDSVIYKVHDDKLFKNIIAPFEAMAYYFYFTFSAMIISSFINSGALILIVVSTFIFYINIKKFRFKSFLFIIINALIPALLIFYFAYIFDRIEYARNPALIIALLNLIILTIYESHLNDKRAEPIKSKNSNFLNTNSIKTFVSLLTIVILLLTFHLFLENIYSIEFFLFTLVCGNTFLFYILRQIWINFNSINKMRLVYLLKLNTLIFLAAFYFGTI